MITSKFYEHAYPSVTLRKRNLGRDKSIGGAAGSIVKLCGHNDAMSHIIWKIRLEFHMYPPHT